MANANTREVPEYDFSCQNPWRLYGFFIRRFRAVGRFRGTIFRVKIRMAATDFFQACSIRFFGTENPCGLAFIRTMFRMEILRHRVQKDFSRTNLVRETSIFRGKF